VAVKVYYITLDQKNFVESLSYTVSNQTYLHVHIHTYILYVMVSLFSCWIWFRISDLH